MVKLLQSKIMKCKLDKWQSECCCYTIVFVDICYIFTQLTKKCRYVLRNCIYWVINILEANKFIVGHAVGVLIFSYEQK